MSYVDNHHRIYSRNTDIKKKKIKSSFEKQFQRVLDADQLRMSLRHFVCLLNKFTHL